MENHTRSSKSEKAEDREEKTQKKRKQEPIVKLKENAQRGKDYD